MSASAAEAGDRQPGSGAEPHSDSEPEPHSQPPLPTGDSDHVDEQSSSPGPQEVREKGGASGDPIPAASLKFLGSVVAPTTLVTALLFYFGVLYAVGYYRFFGVNFTVLDLPLQGVLVLSASTAIMPLALLAVATLFAAWVYRLSLSNRGEGSLGKARRAAAVVLATISTTLLILTAADTVLALRIYPADFGEARGIGLAAGVLGLSYALHLRRHREAGPAPETTQPAPLQAAAIASWGSRFLLVSVGLFWAVGSYAIRVGTTDARAFAADLACVADVTVYSEKSLNLASASVREERTADAESAFGFRYPGLKLIPQAGPQYLLIPADWSPAIRPAIVLARAEALRLEFSPSVSQSLGHC